MTRLGTALLYAIRAFVVGPLGAVLGFVVGMVRGGRSAPPQA